MQTCIESTRASSEVSLSAVPRGNGRLIILGRTSPCKAAMLSTHHHGWVTSKCLAPGRDATHFHTSSCMAPNISTQLQLTCQIRPFLYAPFKVFGIFVDRPYLSLPQHSTLLPRTVAHVCNVPADISVTPLSQSGTLVCPESFNPKHNIVPSFLSAHVCCLPHATLFTPLRPAGTRVWLALPSPQHLTVLSHVTAHVCAPPAHTLVTRGRSPGTSV